MADWGTLRAVTLDERLASLRLAAPSLEVRPVDEALRDAPTERGSRSTERPR